jgi:hypothetical protein
MEWIFLSIYFYKISKSCTFGFPHLNTHKIYEHLRRKEYRDIYGWHYNARDIFGYNVKRIAHNEEPIEEVIVIAAVSVVYKITEHRPKRHTAEDGKVTAAFLPFEPMPVIYQHQNAVGCHASMKEKRLNNAVGERVDAVPHNACGVEKIRNV